MEDADKERWVLPKRKKVQYFYVYDLSWKLIGYLNQDQICELVKMDWNTVRAMKNTHVLRGHYRIQSEPKRQKFANGSDIYYVSDYVYHLKLGLGRIGKITAIPDEQIWHVDGKVVFKADIVRHATAEEIKKYKKEGKKK